MKGDPCSLHCSWAANLKLPISGFFKIIQVGGDSCSGLCRAWPQKSLVILTCVKETACNRGSGKTEETAFSGVSAGEQTPVLLRIAGL